MCALHSFAPPAQAFHRPGGGDCAAGAGSFEGTPAMSDRTCVLCHALPLLWKVASLILMNLGPFACRKTLRCSLELCIRGSRRRLVTGEQIGGFGGGPSERFLYVLSTEAESLN